MLEYFNFYKHFVDWELEKLQLNVTSSDQAKHNADKIRYQMKLE